MFKVFLKGLVFGAGFSISMIVIGTIFVKFFPFSNVANQTSKIETQLQWQKLTNEEKISKSTVLAVARYSKSDNGSMVATITEIYKDNESIKFNYKIGDVYPQLKYYPREHDNRSGAVIFFASSPAEYRQSLYLYDDRIIAYGDMPLKTLIEKFKNPQKTSTQKQKLRNYAVENDVFDRDVPFYKLEVDELIKQSSIIALVKYEKSKSGKLRAIIKEFLKKEPDTVIYYDIGDEQRSASIYPQEKTNYGDGAIIFFSGSPAESRLTTLYKENRIPMFGNMTLELFKKKCKEGNA